MIVFIDTMIYLHYQSINDINFHEFLGDNPIKIIIPRITIRELDKEKNTNSSDKIRERAKKVLKNVEEITNLNTEIRDKVSLELYPEKPKINFDKKNLDPNWNDDYLIATIIQFKIDNPGKDKIILITQDTGPIFSAKNLGIDVIKMPEKYKLPIELGKLELENKELKKTIEKLQNALPSLSLGFSDSDGKTLDNATFYLKKQKKYSDKDIENKINKLKQKYPKMEFSKEKNSKDSKTVYDGLLAVQNIMQNIFNTIPKEEYDKYSKEIDKYLKEYKKYLEEINSLDYISRSIRFQLEIKNDGTAPAEDVSICISFPNGFELYTIDEFLELPLPEEPSPPEKPFSQAEKLSNMLHYSIPDISNINLKNDFANFKELPTFSLKKTNSYELTDHFNRIKHGEEAKLPELFLIFDSFEVAKSFKVKYIIRPANLPEPVEGELNFVIKKDKN